MESMEAKRERAIEKIVAALLGARPTYDDLRQQVTMYLDFIKWLAVANDRNRRIALKPYKPKQAVKNGGRPKVRSIEDDAKLAATVDELQKHYGCATRTETIRRVMGDKYEKSGIRRGHVNSPEVKSQIKTLLNRLSAAKPKNKISRKLKKDISGKK